MAGPMASAPAAAAATASQRRPLRGADRLTRTVRARSLQPRTAAASAYVRPSHAMSKRASRSAGLHAASAAIIASRSATASSGGSGAGVRQYSETACRQRDSARRWPRVRLWIVCRAVTRSHGSGSAGRSARRRQACRKGSETTSSHCRWRCAGGRRHRPAARAPGRAGRRPGHPPWPPRCRGRMPGNVRPVHDVTTPASRRPGLTHSERRASNMARTSASARSRSRAYAAWPGI